MCLANKPVTSGYVAVPTAGITPLRQKSSAPAFSQSAMTYRPPSLGHSHLCRRRELLANYLWRWIIYVLAALFMEVSLLPSCSLPMLRQMSFQEPLSNGLTDSMYKAGLTDKMHAVTVSAPQAYSPLWPEIIDTYVLTSRAYSMVSRDDLS
jgi:hypothetical protein